MGNISYRTHLLWNDISLVAFRMLRTLYAIAAARCAPLSSFVWIGESANSAAVVAAVAAIAMLTAVVAGAAVRAVKIGNFRKDAIVLRRPVTGSFLLPVSNFGFGKSSSAERRRGR